MATQRHTCGKQGSVLHPCRPHTQQHAGGLMGANSKARAAMLLGTLKNPLSRESGFAA